jgi:DUF4097 and DUF4098 domain-containing protein YvlB
MKHFKGKRAALFLFTVLTGSLLVGCGFHYELSFSSKILKKSDAKEFTMEKTKVDKLDKINIDARISDIEVIPGDDYYVEIDYLYWEEEPEYKVEDGELYFDDSKAFPKNYSLNFSLHNHIKVYLPETADLSDVRLESSSGNVTAEGFASDTMKINVSYGDFTVKNASAGKSIIKLSSGNSKISDFNTDDMDFNDSYGNADFKNINIGTGAPGTVGANTFKVVMSSGDLSVNGLRFNSVSISDSYGDVSCENIVSPEFDAALSSGDLDVSNADLKDIDVSDSYGHVTMSLTGPKDDYALDLKTSYGNILIDGENHNDKYSIGGGTREINADLSSGDISINFK